MRCFFIMAVALALAVPREAASQARADSGDLKTAISRLDATLRDSGPFLQRLTAAAQWLINNYPRTNPADVSAEYARSIQTAADLLKARPSAEVVEDVANELEAKVEHCRVTGVGMGGSVMLKVDTRLGRERRVGVGGAGTVSVFR
jgi:hypothetical protein